MISGAEVENDSELKRLHEMQPEFYILCKE